MKVTDFIRRVAPWVLDLVCVLVSYYLAAAIRFSGQGLSLSRPESRVSTYMILVLLLMVTFLNFFMQRNRGFMKRTGTQEFGAIVTYNFWLLVGIAVLVLVLHIEPMPSRLLLIYFVIIDIVIMVILRSLAKKAARVLFDSQRLGSSILMIVEKGQRERIECVFETGTSYSIVGWLELDEGLLRGTVAGKSISATIQQLPKALLGVELNDIFIFAPMASEDETSTLIDAAKYMGANSHLVALDLFDPNLKGVQLDRFGGVPTLSYQGRSGKFYLGNGERATGVGYQDDDQVRAAAERLDRRYGYRFAKRAFDIVFSLLVFALLWWVYVIVALAIKLDDPKGPVFFVQERVGKDGKSFNMYKFRSMYVDAEKRLAELQSLNEKDGPVFKIREDPRITRVGKVIRKTSLDEMPQFLNVLLGNMSIVGPRPALRRETDQYTPHQRERLLVKPGITCYWQTRKNRDDIGFDEWVDLDLLYIEQCSVWVDCKLIVQTIGCVLTAQGS